MKNTLLLILFSMTIYLAYPQKPTHQDCLGAIPLCKNVYDEPDPYAYSGNGNYPVEITDYDSSCIAKERNGLWYTFNPQSNGNLSFTIKPHVIKDDYDWVVFDLTNGSCRDLEKDARKYTVSSNTYGSHNNIDSTGANSKYSGGKAGNCNGPNTENGPPWNDDIPVYEGHTYVLYISNFTKSKNGYRIDYSSSTAKILDNIGSILYKVTNSPLSAYQDTVKFNFSEIIDCKSLSLSSFSITQQGTNIPFGKLSGVACELGQDYSREYSIITNQKLATGDYFLNLLDNNIKDACGNLSRLNSIPFKVDDLKIISVDSVNLKCNGGNDGQIKIIAQSGTSSLLYSIDGGKSYVSNLGNFTKLTAGNYQVAVKTPGGYEKTGITVTLSEPPPMIFDSASKKDVKPYFDSKNGTISVYAHGGSQKITYSIDGGINFIDNNGKFSNLDAGSYPIAIKDSNQCVVIGETVIIQKPENLEIIIPNSFTPDGDGINETWKIRNIEHYPSVIIKVYNRWSVLLFESKGYNNPWDGTFNGKKLPSDSYFYFIDLKDGGKPIVGYLTIIR